MTTIMAALPTSTKPATAMSKAQEKLNQNKMHRRSRSGCFTCRLRRKKCDEHKPGCKACHKLGLTCEYKRPMWWGNADERKAYKDMIKTSIKNLKIHEKHIAAQQIPLPNDPPALYHSPSDGICRTRGGSMDSSISDQFNFNTPQSTDVFHPQIVQSSQAPGTSPFSDFQPFNQYCKVEMNWAIDNVDIRRDSTISNTFFEAVPSTEESLMDSWVQRETLEHTQEILDESVDFNSMIDFANFQMPPPPLITLPSQVTSPVPVQTEAVATSSPVEARDAYLLKYFKESIVPMAFPVMQLSGDLDAHSKFLIAPLDNNRAYYHAALSYAATQIKARGEAAGAEIDEDLNRHFYNTVKVITEWLQSHCNVPQIAEATLAMIYLRGLVGGLDQDILEIPWESHFQATKDAFLAAEDEITAESKTAAAWIDILGATMKGTKPAFADTYRNDNVSNKSIGLAELVGCDDRILFLISEIACLEAIKNEGALDDINLCFHIKSLGDHISATENNTSPSSSPSLSASNSTSPANVYNAFGAVDPSQLTTNITALYRTAARIYLCSLLPEFDGAQPNIQALVSTLAGQLSFIPAGRDGFDRSLVWPLLMAGSVAAPNSELRAVLIKRAEAMESLQCGSFARLMTLLQEVWRRNDEAAQRGEQNVHWRDVMTQCNWNFLLI